MTYVDPIVKDNEIWKLCVAKQKAISGKKDIPPVVDHIIKNRKEYTLEEINTLGMNQLFPPNNQWRKGLEKVSKKRLELLNIIKANEKNAIDTNLLSELVQVLNGENLSKIADLKYRLVTIIIHIHVLSGQITDIKIEGGLFINLKEVKLPYSFSVMLQKHNTLIGKIKRSKVTEFLNIDELTSKVYKTIIAKHVLLRRLNDYLIVLGESKNSEEFLTRFIKLYYQVVNSDDVNLYTRGIVECEKEVQSLLTDIQHELDKI